MALDAQKALLDALKTRLDADPLWGTRIFFEDVPPLTAYPYLWITHSAGVDMEVNKRSNPVYIMGLQGVTDNQNQAFECKERVAVLLDDEGEQDVGASVSGDADWAIKTISRTEDIYFVELADRAKRIYRIGNLYEFIMERKT